MPVKYEADYTLETLKREREKYKEENPPPIILETFNQSVCEEKLDGEWEEGKDTCIVPNIDTISITNGSLNFIFSDPRNRYKHRFQDYEGNYHLLFDIKDQKGGKGEILGTFSTTSIQDRYFSEEEERRIGIPTQDVSKVLYFPSNNPAMAKIKKRETQFSAKTKYGNYEPISVLDVEIEVKAKKEKEEEK